MRRRLSCGLAAILIFAIVFSGCGGKREELSLSPSQSVTCVAGGVPFNMIFIPAVTNFPTGLTDTDTGSVSNDFWMAETEVTYKLWSTVYQWALTRGYQFANTGSRGGYCNSSKTGEGTYASGDDTHPVTSINWWDAMIWCNVLTEYIYKNSANCVYLTEKDNTMIPLRIKTETTVLTINQKAQGFRLPTSDEWELVARYQNGAIWTPGNHVSGDTTSGYGSSTLFGNYAWYWGNSNASDANTYSTQPVGQKAANSLGIKDLSGNVLEWCFDASGLNRICRGGSWYDEASDLQIGLAGASSPDSGSIRIGFRPVRMQ